MKRLLYPWSSIQFDSFQIIRGVQHVNRSVPQTCQHNYGFTNVQTSTLCPFVGQYDVNDNLKAHFRQIGQISRPTVWCTMLLFILVFRRCLSAAPCYPLFEFYGLAEYFLSPSRYMRLDVALAMGAFSCQLRRIGHAWLRLPVSLQP